MLSPLVSLKDNPPQIFSSSTEVEGRGLGGEGFVGGGKGSLERAEEGGIAEGDAVYRVKMR